MIRPLIAIILLILLLTQSFEYQLTSQDTLESLESLSTQFASQTKILRYDTKTAENFNMDCLKAIKNKNGNVIGVFHSSIEQKASGFNAIYYARETNSVWNKVIKLSERGSQGYIY